MASFNLTDAFNITADLAHLEPIYAGHCRFCQYPLNYNNQIGTILTKHDRNCLWQRARDYMDWIKDLA